MNRCGLVGTPAHTTNTIKVVQINADRKGATHDVVNRRARRDGVDLLLVSEPNKRLSNKGGWLTDTRKDAAIVFCGREIIVINKGAGGGYVWVELAEAVVYSCYCSPNVAQQQFEKLLDDLSIEIRRRNKPVIVAGDFNAKSAEWGSPNEDRRGTVMTEWMSALGMVVLNRGDRPTFVRKNQRSYIDVTMCTEGLGSRVINWKVLREETLGWHQMITFGICEKKTRQEPSRTTGGWRISGPSLERFGQIFGEKATDAMKREDSAQYQHYVAQVIRCCEEVFPRRNAYRRHQEVYWWCDAVKERRDECKRARRRMTRINRGGDENSRATAAEEYKWKKREYNRAILDAKKSSWRSMLRDLDEDQWGQGYRIVMKRTNMGTKIRMNEEQQMTVARTLFPTVDDRVGRRVETPTEEAEPFTIEELRRATDRLKTGKAPGPDGILPAIAKVAVRNAEEWFRAIANEALATGTFPDEMKKARLALVPKPAKEGTTVETKYRPISLLGSFAKIMEAMIEERLKIEIMEAGGLHERQYGFRAGRSAVGAAMEVVGIARRATSAAAQHKKICALVAIDVKNAFNTVRWTDIMEALERRNISGSIRELVRSYLAGRTLIVGEGRRMDLSCGVPQGSVLGPLLWSVFYDGVLGVEMPDGATVVGYADDLALVVVAKTQVELKSKTETAMVGIGKWMREKGLTVAAEKTELVLLSGRRKLKELTITVGENEIRSTKHTKYLGIYLDKDLRMTEHVRRVTERANEVTAKLARIMPNIGGPRASKRRIIAGAVMSIVLYGAPVWGGVLRHGKYRKMLQGIQRKLALRISSAYRTVSLEAAQVITGMIPVDILVRERTATHEAPEERERAREQSMEEWQERWKNLRGKAEWTRKLIQRVEPWKNRKHGEVNYQLSQFLTGHGSFRAYLYKIKKVEDAECSYCREAADTVQHTMYECARWVQARWRLASELTVEFTPENTIAAMLADPSSWEAVNTYVVTVINQKETDERKAEAAAENNRQ